MGQRTSWVARSLNALGALGNAIGLRPSLHPEDLIAHARRLAGTGQDFERDDWREPLEILCQSLEREADLTFLGQFLARTDISRRLRNRLLLEQSLRHHPEIVEGPVAAPVFILGLPRTGTTLLHRLLGRDPQNRVLLGWETDCPAPPPETATYENDPRITRSQRDFNGLNWINPRFRQIHEVGAQLPEECINLMANDLVSLWFALAYDTPAYRDWFNGLDHTRCYENHRRQLQLLQYRHAGTRWVLKAPIHMLGLGSLLRVYPDAHFVQTHRDPAAVVPSSASLIATFRQPLHRHADPERVGSAVLEDLHRWWSAAQRVRATAVDLPWIDVEYRDLVANPMAVVRTIYDTFGLELTSAVEASMVAFLSANWQHKHGVHRYRPEDFGLTEVQIRERFDGDM
jgi:hypothetical protein